MEKKGKRKYEKPISKVYSLQTEQFLQTVSVTPDGKNSENNVPWENEQEYQGGTITIGDDSNTAPAKKNNIWSDGEE